MPIATHDSHRRHRMTDSTPLVVTSARVPGRVEACEIPTPRQNLDHENRPAELLSVVPISIKSSWAGVWEAFQSPPPAAHARLEAVKITLSRK